MKFIVDLWLDGYDTKEEMNEACTEFIYEQLNMTASSVKIEDYGNDDEDEESQKNFNFTHCSQCGKKI